MGSRWWSTWLDHFKAVNDRYGHLAGDKVLQTLVRCLSDAVRITDGVFRYGGEEFLFILRNTNITEGRIVAERVRERVGADAIHARNMAIKVSLSLGIAQACEHDTVDALIDRADAALYAAKTGGRDRVVSAQLLQEDSK